MQYANEFITGNNRLATIYKRKVDALLNRKAPFEELRAAWHALFESVHNRKPDNDNQFLHEVPPEPEV